MPTRLLEKIRLVLITSIITLSAALTIPLVQGADNRLTANFHTDYIFDSEMLVSDAGGTRLIGDFNKLENSEFESDLNNWSFYARSLDSDVEEILNSSGSTIPAKHQDLVSNTVLQFKDKNIWDKIDAMWFMAAHSETAAKINWKDPENHTLELMNDMEFEVDRGIGGGESGGNSTYADTNWSPTIDGVNYTLNEASIGIYSRTAINGGYISIAGPASSFTISTSGRTWVQINAGETRPRITYHGVPIGLYAGTRISNLSNHLYVDGNNRGNGNQSSVEIPDGKMFIGGSPSEDESSVYASSPRQYAFAFMGGLLDNDNHSDLYDIVQNYLTEIGANIGDPVELEDLISVNVSIEDSITHRDSRGSVKISAESIVQYAIQHINTRDTSLHTLVAYAYTDGSDVTSNEVELFANGSTIETTYEKAGDGWYKLSGTVEGANESREYGAQVKPGKTVYLDDFTLARQGNYSMYKQKAFKIDNLERWETFDPKFEGDHSKDLIYFQLCTDNGEVCEKEDKWRYWHEKDREWKIAKNDTSHRNKASEITNDAMKRFPTRFGKISVKTFFDFRGDYVPTLRNLSFDYTTDKGEKITPTEGTSIGLTHIGRIPNAGVYETFYYTSEQVEFKGNITPPQGDFDVQIIVNGIEIARRPTTQTGEYNIPLTIPRGTNNVEIKIASLDTEAAIKKLTLIIDPTRQSFPQHLR